MLISARWGKTERREQLNIFPRSNRKKVVFVVEKKEKGETSLSLSLSLSHCFGDKTEGTRC